MFSRESRCRTFFHSAVALEKDRFRKTKGSKLNRKPCKDFDPVSSHLITADGLGKGKSSSTSSTPGAESSPREDAAALVAPSAQDTHTPAAPPLPVDALIALAAVRKKMVDVCIVGEDLHSATRYALQALDFLNSAAARNARRGGDGVRPPPVLLGAAAPFTFLARESFPGLALKCLFGGDSDAGGGGERAETDVDAESSDFVFSENTAKKPELALDVLRAELLQGLAFGFLPFEGGVGFAQNLLEKAAEFVR